MGAYTEIVDFTFTANETSRTFSGLSITKDDFIKVKVTISNTIASTQNFRLLANNSVNANYHMQLLQGFTTNVGAARENNNRLARIGANKNAFAYAYLKLTENDRLNIFTNHNFEIDTGVSKAFIYSTSSGATFTSGITSLTLQAETNNAIGTGSRIQIYKLAATKVADITVASNTTQVDISNLSIDKDSEYLLVSDIGQAVSDDVNLFINDNITATNYNNQLIFGNGSSASAARINAANYATTRTSLSYTHIKLSNIGAYTYQSYEIRFAGSSSIQLFNYFGSSTAENITSITKLNIRSGTNSIAAGSRFILYKLYE